MLRGVKAWDGGRKIIRERGERAGQIIQKIHQLFITFFLRGIAIRGRVGFSGDSPGCIYMKISGNFNIGNFYNVTFFNPCMSDCPQSSNIEVGNIVVVFLLISIKLKIFTAWLNPIVQTAKENYTKIEKNHPKPPPTTTFLRDKHPSTVVFLHLWSYNHQEIIIFLVGRPTHVKVSLKIQNCSNLF